MSSEKPLLVVLGATGNQGGSVLSYYLSLSPSPYALRGVTRDPTSPKATSLSSCGVEMVTGNIDDPASLDAAFKGASAIFSVTDYWQHYASPAMHEKAASSGQNIMLLCREKETQQNKNIIDAAAKVGSLEKFIYSSLPNAGKVSGGKYSHVYHFDGKGLAEEYGKATYPELWKKTNVLYAGFYLENYTQLPGIRFLPKWKNTKKDSLVLDAAGPLAVAPLPMYSVVDDTGAIVDALLRATPSKKLIGVNKWTSYKDFAKLFAEVLGKSLEFADKSPNLDMGDPALNQDYADMMAFCVEFKYDGSNADKSIVQPTELGVSLQLQSLKEWILKQDWEKTILVDE